jgi:hypothetical protein
VGGPPSPPSQGTQCLLARSHSPGGAAMATVEQLGRGCRGRGEGAKARGNGRPGRLGRSVPPAWRLYLERGWRSAGGSQGKPGVRAFPAASG